MAAINFPDAPTNGQIFESGGMSWTYVAGIGWTLNSAIVEAGSGFTFIADTMPLPVNVGDTWFDSSTGASGGTSWVAVEEGPAGASEKVWVQFAPGTASLMPDSIDNTLLANMPANTFKGNNTGASADPKDLTKAEMQAALLIPTRYPRSTTRVTSPLTFLAGHNSSMISISSAAAPAGMVYRAVYSLFANQTTASSFDLTFNLTGLSQAILQRVGTNLNGVYHLEREIVSTGAAVSASLGANLWAGQGLYVGVGSFVSIEISDS